MAATTDKENLLSFAFAYFMETSPTQKNNQLHFDDWNKIFEDFKIADNKSKYKSFLEYNFDYSGLKNSYAYDKTQGSQLKKVNHIFTVYYQIEELYFSSFLDKNKKYRIYTQSSSFTKTVKDACIKKLFEVFDLKGTPQTAVSLLSPVDFFVVDYDNKKKIEDEFKNNILNVKNDTDILINYEKNKDRTYEHLIAKYFKSKDLIGISHKLPKGKSKNASIKIAGNIGKLGKYNLKNIDPYSQMIIELQQKTPSQVEKLINEVIDIKYNDWDIRDNRDSSTWRLYFNFNFKKLNSQFNDAKFGLEPLPGTGSGSYNGKFYIDGSRSPWVAGMAPATIEQFIKKYGEYNQIMTRLAKKRVEAFMSVFPNTKESEIKKSSKGSAALSFLNQKTFQSFSTTKNKVEPYFIEIKQPRLFEEYQKKLIELLKTEGKFSSDVNSIRNVKQISNHYISIQMSYFWIYGGRNFKTYLKKRIFFTVFGAITKRGFVSISNNKLIQLAEKEYDEKRKDVKVSITSAPHIILM
jgi:hypothetical protein